MSKKVMDGYIYSFKFIVRKSTGIRFSSILGYGTSTGKEKETQHVRKFSTKVNQKMTSSFTQSTTFDKAYRLL